MKNKININSITIEYKDDEEAKQRFLDFILTLLLADQIPIKEEEKDD